MKCLYGHDGGADSYPVREPFPLESTSVRHPTDNRFVWVESARTVTCQLVRTGLTALLPFADLNKAPFAGDLITMYHLTSRRQLFISVIVFSAGLAACAGPGMPPTAQIADARTSLAQAESTGARDAAPLQLAAARDKLAKADAAMKAEQYPKAKDLYEEAQADAQLADRMARATRAKTAASELARSNLLLREELDRKTPR